MPDFEVFDQKRRQTAKTPLITLQARGAFSFNEAAYEAMGRPQRIELLFAPEERIVGFRPTNGDVPHAYPIHKQPNGRTFQSGGGKAFCNHYGIPTGQSRRFEGRMYDGILGIDLNEQPIQSRRSSKKAS
jgi:hypothetical protein